VIVAAPFLAANSWAYVQMSFNFGRKFLYQWTVNLKFLSEVREKSPACRRMREVNDHRGDTFSSPGRSPCSSVGRWRWR
jgi:hypothetical protein